MHLISRTLGKFLVNAVILYVADYYFYSFTITGGIRSVISAALVITLLNIFVKPILRFVSTPLVWLTLGLFLIVINAVVLWVADILLPSIQFADFTSFIVLSIIIGFANSII